jgi:hypothetical protein
MSNAPLGNKEGSGPQPSPKLPDMAICRAVKMEYGSFVSCLVNSPGRCPYLFCLGYEFFCEHPDREGIIARTKV